MNDEQFRAIRGLLVTIVILLGLIAAILLALAWDYCDDSRKAEAATTEATEAAASTAAAQMSALILERASVSRASGQWRDDDYDVLEDGVVVGRIFLSPSAPQDRQWMWASGHNGNIRRAAHGYEPRGRSRWPRSLRAGAGVKIGQLAY